MAIWTPALAQEAQVGAPAGVEQSDAPPAEIADGDAGGPDFWRVEGIGAGSTLAVRLEPDIDSQVLGEAAASARLANLGCRGEGAERWCRVRIEGGAVGWVAGAFLREWVDDPAPPKP